MVKWESRKIYGKYMEFYYFSFTCFILIENCRHIVIERTCFNLFVWLTNMINSNSYYYKLKWYSASGDLLVKVWQFGAAKGRLRQEIFCKKFEKQWKFRENTGNLVFKIQIKYVSVNIFLSKIMASFKSSKHNLIITSSV